MDDSWKFVDPYLHVTHSIEPKALPRAESKRLDNIIEKITGEK